MGCGPGKPDASWSRYGDGSDGDMYVHSQPWDKSFSYPYATEKSATSRFDPEPKWNPYRADIDGLRAVAVLAATWPMGTAASEFNSCVERLRWSFII
eukprot:Skav226581  [mRNA]  locus=scaffold2846:103165:104293:- [translate_table: standard]